MLVTVGTQGCREELAPLLSSICHYRWGKVALKSAHPARRTEDAP